MLLDESTPHLNGVIIQGELVFDRQDLHLQANYIYVKEGSLLIGTEEEPFEQQATITLHGSVDTLKAIPLRRLQKHFRQQSPHRVLWGENRTDPSQIASLTQRFLAVCLLLAWH